MKIEFNLAASDERLLVLNMLAKGYEDEFTKYLNDNGYYAVAGVPLSDISVDDQPVLTDDEKDAIDDAVADIPDTPPSHKVKTTETETDLGPDVDGIPWDNRIHARTKVKNRDGTWRKKRGVDPELVATVEAELRQALEAPPAPPVGGPGPEGSADPLSNLVPPPPPAGEPITFSMLLQKVSELKTHGKLADDDFKDLYESVGLPNFATLQHRPDLLPGAWDKVKDL